VGLLRARGERCSLKPGAEAPESSPDRPEARRFLPDPEARPALAPMAGEASKISPNGRPGRVLCAP
ncbi:MAG TPA: hypothetical protein VFS00_26765, partial [Polyangiaceae bacterium]|nr:hypothetical protein [Polyangiaceae bacterium]